MGMNYLSRTARRTLRTGALGALVAGLLIGGQAPATAATPTSPALTPTATAELPLAYGDICHSDLPAQAYDTLDLIAQGGPYPHPQDGGTFYNREGLLPSQPTGYYHEYTVETPGSDDRGARRIVTGDSYEEDYYTSDHYASFDLIDYAC
ncbi:ribonuclease domain-containing protein [Streptomyces johnsoniae]|uniref:Ribonuclease domain-containing protein n=1 Tax=Streptomyces johnsoniae TaxID=3075532 RepID=A0ABU2S2Y5_9ACTN|nr:ribonuclease domain-containing protein [Streptomyces sp. DSM 41886]MDT0442169.1 ribonuclease domain-containing protein [Streptomyces sp. DSM 41886]